MLIPLTKINISAEKNARDRILDLLQEKEIMEIAEIKDIAGETPPIVKEALVPATQGQNANFHLNRVKTAMQFLGRYNRSKKSFKKMMETAFNPEIALSKRGLEKIIKIFDYKNIIERMFEIQKDINLQENIMRESQINLKALAEWKNINFAPQKTKILKKVEILLGVTPISIFLSKRNKSTTGQKNTKTAENDFYDKLNKETDGLCLMELAGQTEREVKIIIGFLKTRKETVKKILSDFNFKEIDIPYPDKKPRDAIKYLEEKIKKSQKAFNDLEKKIIEMARENFTKLRVIHDYLVWQTEKDANARKIAATRYLFSLDGWIEEKNIAPLEKAILAITPHFAVTKLKINAREAQPVILKNKIFQSYEAVTDIYGLPLPGEPDPTPFLAPFFTIFFALALTDAGYGIILTLFCWLAIKLLKIPRNQQNIFKVLIYAGIMTIVLGALFGGWFGIVPKNLPDSFGPLKTILMKIWIIDPVADPMKVLFIAFILGVIQIWFGILIGVWWNIKKGDIKKAILDYGVWNFFLAALIFWVITKMGYINSLAIAAQYALFAGAAGIIFTQGRRHKNIISKLGIGVISLYSLVNYMGDVLSYSRLLALGLATGIIAMVINLIAVIFKDLAPFDWLGWVVAILVLIGGHTFNLAINTLGAFIHSGRLQFVEFFPKFMEGGGRKFKPFARKSDFIRMIS